MGNQNPYIEEEHTTQWPHDTKGVIRIRISKKNRQHNGQRKSTRLQNIHIKLKTEYHEPHITFEPHLSPRDFALQIFQQMFTHYLKYK